MSDLFALLGFVLALSALMTDELLTKVGLKLGCKETNHVFNFLNKKMEEKTVHFLLTIIGISMLLCVLVVFGNGPLLMFFAAALNVPVIINAVTLLRHVSLKNAYDSSVKQPQHT